VITDVIDDFSGPKNFQKKDCSSDDYQDVKRNEKTLNERIGYVDRNYLPNKNG